MAKAKKVAKKSAKKVTKPARKPAAKAKKAAPAKKTSSAKVTPKKMEKIDWNRFLTPLDDRIIVQSATAEKMTAGGLFIPDTSMVKAQSRGTVLAIGRGHLNKKGKVRPMDVQAGDVVLFEEYAGSKANLNGADVRILRESEILGIVEK